MEKRKKTLLILGLCIFTLALVGLSYAFWQITLQQDGENEIATACLDIEKLKEGTGITLNPGYPISDSDGEALDPYTFTIHNKCNDNLQYQINVEVLDESDLNAKYVKVKLDKENQDGTISKLMANRSVEPTLTKEPTIASEAYELEIGYLEANASKSFEFRQWMDGDTKGTDTDSMNKTFKSKITITATYTKEGKKTLEETILALEPKTEDSGDTGLYEVEHTGANITYTTNPLYIQKLQKTEYRYAGTDPSNYVSFGEIYSYNAYIFNDVNSGPSEEYDSIESCEENNIDKEGECEIISHEIPIYWRIIGLVNTPEGQRIKLIRNESIGSYSWDTSSSDINNGYGVNEWSQSDLMKLLNPGYENNKDEICTYNDEESIITCNDEMDLVNNSLYWDGETGKCYVGESNDTSDCDFTNNKMPDNLKSMIDTITWNTGSDDGKYATEGTALKFYEYEKSSNISKCDENDYSCDDKVERMTSWKGKVGLISPSDYGYATIGGSGTTRTSCLNKNLYNWGDSECYYNNDWLYYENSWQWTISPNADSSDVHYVFAVYSQADGGYVARSDTYYTSAIRPVVYLKPNIFVKQGDGSLDNPYILEK